MLARTMNDFAPLMRLQDGMNRWFENFFEDVPQLRGHAAGYPGLNLWEDGDTARVEAELPGLGMDDIEIYVQGNQLTVSGERKAASEPGEAVYHRRERAAGRFSRTLTLPWEVDADRVEAKLHNGVLTVTLPKCESCKPRKVKVLSA